MDLLTYVGINTEYDTIVDIILDTVPVLRTYVRTDKNMTLEYFISRGLLIGIFLFLLAKITLEFQ